MALSAGGNKAFDQLHLSAGCYRFCVRPNSPSPAPDIGARRREAASGVAFCAKDDPKARARGAFRPRRRFRPDGPDGAHTEETLPTPCAPSARSSTP